ncbi:hypothetical protein HBB16_04325 [Pseudonocardia sp. MCCB 268]|nr:hypothetical protein [Pseudonocardia cytotoxica]
MGTPPAGQDASANPAASRLVLLPRLPRPWPTSSASRRWPSVRFWASSAACLFGSSARSVAGGHVRDPARSRPVCRARGYRRATVKSEKSQETGHLVTIRSLHSPVALLFPPQLKECSSWRRSTATASW